NDREDIGKLSAQGDIGFFIGYSVNSVAYRVYNWRTKKIVEMMNVTFDELSAMAFEQNSSRPGLQSLTSGQISFGLKLTYAPSTITPQRPSERDFDILFESLHNEYLGGRPSEAPRTIPAALVIQNLLALIASMSIKDSTRAPTNSSNTPVSSNNVDTQQHAQQQRNRTPSPTASAADDVPNAMFEGDLLVNPFATPSTESVVSSTQYVDPSNMHTFYQPYPHDYQWTEDHPLEQVIREPSRLVLTRNQLKTDGDMCIYALTVGIMELKSVKKALTDPAWIESMQEELHQFIRLDVWELISSPDGIKPLTLKWLFKNKHDEENTVIHNKTRNWVLGEWLWKSWGQREVVGSCVIGGENGKRGFLGDGGKSCTGTDRGFPRYNQANNQRPSDWRIENKHGGGSGDFLVKERTPSIRRITGSKTLSSFLEGNDRKVSILEGSVRKRIIDVCDSRKIVLWKNMKSLRLDSFDNEYSGIKNFVFISERKRGREENH
nr:hypothetical protein [Tanacetum cinerariifolium]